MMKAIRRICILMCCLALLLSGVLGVNAASRPHYNVYFASGHPLSREPFSYLHGNAKLIRWDKDKVIHMNYDVSLTILDEIHDNVDEYPYTYRVESTLDISHTLDQQQAYTNQDQYLVFDVRLLEIPEKHIIDFNKDSFSESDLPVLDKISIIATWEGVETHVTSIYLLNCQYGLFLCGYPGDRAYSRLSEWVEDYQRNITWGIGIAVIAVICAVSFVIWLMRRNRIKKRIAAIQAIPAAEPNAPPEQPLPDDKNQP